MLSIGEFSRICEVTPKTLRYYEEIGLLYPEEISFENGYRYYSIKQLEKMLLINRLKSYKLTLEEIKSITGSMEVSSENQLFSIFRYFKICSLFKRKYSCKSLRNSDE